MNNYQNRLNDIITEYRKICIAYSGGVDSTLLLYLTSRLRPVIAVIIDGEMVPRDDIKAAESFAQSLDNVTLVKVPFDPLSIQAFRDNSQLRCYYCKKALFNEITKVARKYNCDVIFDGSNLDDLSDYRPGLKAIEELNVQSPFVLAGLNKEHIYNLSNLYDLPTKNKASSACLASRIKTGEPVTREKLNIIEKGEKFLKQFGFSQFRLRLLPESGYIEILRKEFPLFKSNRETILEGLSKLGIPVEKEPREYKQGSMNMSNTNEENTTVITMIDEEGNEQEFEFLGETTFLGKEYILIADMDSTSDLEETIHPEIVEVINGESESPTYQTVTDKDLFEKIMALFIEENPDDFIYI